MKARGFLLAMTLTVGISGQAAASDNIDFRDVSCTEFLETIQTSNRDDVTGMMLWLNGYANGLSERPVIDWDGIETFFDRVISRCRSRGSARIIDIISNSSNRR